MNSWFFRTCCIVWLSAVAACAHDAAPARAAGPDGFLKRVEALALLQTFNADLLSHDSATLTLERWCDAHGLASPAQTEPPFERDDCRSIRRSRLPRRVGDEPNFASWTCRCKNPRTSFRDQARCSATFTHRQAKKNACPIPGKISLAANFCFEFVEINAGGSISSHEPRWGDAPAEF